MSNVYNSTDLTFKCYYNGTRLTEHEKCETGYALKHCAACCDVPEYPSNGIGNITNCTSVKLDVPLTNFAAFDSMKHSDGQHFIKCDEHWSNLMRRKNTKIS